jgi:hypothetical protein
MTTRDRLMLMGIVAMAVLLGVWFTTVAPERERASKVTAEVEAAREQVATAESQADSATNARAQYSTAYASLVSLGQAVPASAETPALIYTLDKASHRRDVQFSSITNGSAGSNGSGPSAAPAGAASTGFAQQPFTFVFNGSFVDLYKLFNQLEGFTVQAPSGPLHVNGRLLTIDSVSLTPNAGEAQGSSASKKKSGQLTGTVTATAYVLPTGQTALGGATPSGPAGTTPAANTSSATSNSASAPSATPTAVVKAGP